MILAAPRSAQAGRPAGSIQLARSRRGWPLGLIGAVAIVVLAEGYVARRRDELSSIFAVEWRWNVKQIRRHAAGPAVLCLGTSLSRTGVSPLVIEERTGMPAYNFAGSGSQPFANVVSLRRALANGARPRAIVVDFAWTTLGQPDTFNETGLAEIASLADIAEFARAARDASIFGRTALAWLMPSLRGRAEVRANIDAALRGVEPNRNLERFFYARNAEANRGACHPASLGYDGAVDPANPVLFPAHWSCTAANEHFIDEFFDLAASRGIAVFWALPPMTAETRALWESSGTRSRYLGLVESVAARHSNVTVVDATDARYPVAAFNDPVHLNRDGAVAFTAGVADAIRDRRAGEGGPRTGWARLPDYRPDPSSRRVEDTRDTLARIQGAMRR